MAQARAHHKPLLMTTLFLRAGCWLSGAAAAAAAGHGRVLLGASRLGVAADVDTQHGAGWDG
jgi:hypothetical protein